MPHTYVYECGAFHAQGDNDDDSDDVAGAAAGVGGTGQYNNGSVEEPDGRQDQGEEESRDKRGRTQHDMDSGFPEESLDLGGVVHVTVKPPAEEFYQGLPDDETSIDIPPSSVQAPPLRPTSFPR